MKGNLVFFVYIFKSKTHKVGYQVKLKFQISQHSRDIQLIKNIIKYLGSGILIEVKSSVDLVNYKFLDLESIIVPLFNNYPLRGNKILDFLDFCKVVSAVKNKDPLEGLKYIKQIKSKMNTQRHKNID